MMKLNLKKGFTLIELLVVIAIIGILSGIVLSSLNTARGKGSDAAIKSNMASIRSQAELVYDANSCYSDGIAAGSGCLSSAVAPGACSGNADTIFGEPTVASQIAAAKAQSAAGTSGAGNACSSNAGQQAYAIVTQLKTAPLSAWCIDSTGKSKQVTITAAGSTPTQTEINAEVTTNGLCAE